MKSGAEIHGKTRKAAEGMVHQWEWSIIFPGEIVNLRNGRGLFFPRTLCYRAPYYVFPTFSSVFCCVFPFSLRKKCRIFCAALLGGGLGVWGFGGWGFGGGVPGGGGGFRGGGGGGHNSVRVCVCVCAVVSPFPFFKRL